MERVNASKSVNVFDEERGPNFPRIQRDNGAEAEAAEAEAAKPHFVFQTKGSFGLESSSQEIRRD